MLRTGGRLARLALGFFALAFLMAPTPGDVGGCGQRAQELDPVPFFNAKANLDCDRCFECDLESERCSTACGTTPPESSFPEGCVPLVHDGEVCLNALADASCDEFADSVRDDDPKIPSECGFCPRKEP